nr:MarR family winged helix-turn-helix transcriptional regulator [uncultured Rhodopila sp.]
MPPFNDPATPIYASETYTPVGSIGRLIADAAAMLSRAIDRRAREVGLTGPQWVMLMRIAHGMGSTAAELCRTIGYDSGSMTRMLDRLVDQGLIRRDRSDEDRRIIHLSLTEAGEALRPRLSPVAVEVLNQHLRGFTAEEAATLTNLLQRLLANGAPE